MTTQNKLHWRLVDYHFIPRKQKFFAYVTWKGYDFDQIGDTDYDAIYYLLKEHAKDFGLTDSDIENYTIRILAENRK